MLKVKKSPNETAAILETLAFQEWNNPKKAADQPGNFLIWSKLSMATFSSNCSPGRYPFSLPTTNTFVENIPLSTSQQVKGTVSGDFSTLFLLFQLGPISCAKPVLLTLLFSHILYSIVQSIAKFKFACPRSF